MKYITYLIVIILLLGINIGVFNNLKIYGQMPNLLFLLAFCASLEKDDYTFFFVSLVSGLFLDFYSTGFFGGFTLAFLTVSLCAHFFSDNVLVVGFNRKTLGIALLVGFLFFNLMVWVYGLVAFNLNLTSGYASFKEMTAMFLPGLFYNLMLLYPIYELNNSIRQFLRNWDIRRRGVIR